MATPAGSGGMTGALRARRRPQGGPRALVHVRRALQDFLSGKALCICFPENQREA